MDSKSFRRLQRQEPTPAEMRMWSILRDRRFSGYKFRRQHSIGKYTVDFYCHRLKLVVEVDGKVHDELGQCFYDYERDQWLSSQGIIVVRYENEALLKWCENVTDDLLALIKDIESKE
ncbi:hypothetical protein Pedsa_3809 [Pseudopedobacter saltans DSM 12145]|uniref:DUF559 domain-containing protein n=1 Tax=Pseudopedobacter saltans (strain ATCC 51119 / DSM 12145 / JCM 21818 / CCUG 39354 / LMG 10337 / NBRC 100064 / NCIMB 13643) TaxID=762903 RepID=F0S765_PSESL|nr:DUF559 domain-containing protein [Pseudopedobacter saltans]ADY54338.1 hypothetical protein Pedsa_3809 [Pseudopedobacter saltans DSM 12145]